jgi:hypothetical protein
VSVDPTDSLQHNLQDSLQDNLPDDCEAAPFEDLAGAGVGMVAPPAPGCLPWEQLAGEPEHWFGRFQVYLALGPARTLMHSSRNAGLQVRNRPYALSACWINAARRWRWRERALAWDAQQRELMALSERNARISLRDRRVAMIDDYLEAVHTVLDNANLAAADQELARAWLPQMRFFLRDLLVAQREEYERDAYAKDDPGNAVTITADDLRAAQRALDQAAATSSGREGITAGRGETGGGRAEPAVPQATSAKRGEMAAGQGAERTLFVCAGAESAFMLDLAALRAVRSATGLQFRRLLDATRVKFERHLRRERGLGRPVELLHLALHAGPAGVEFGDGVADGNWLSERLFGVRVMLIAGCASSRT